MRDPDPVAAFLTLLDEERAMLLAARTDELAQIALRKDTLVAALETVSLTRADLGRIARAMARQSTLLEACRDGLQGAQSRLAEVRSVRSGLNHYTRDGLVKTIAAAGSTVETRA